MKLDKPQFKKPAQQTPYSRSHLREEKDATTDSMIQSEAQQEAAAPDALPSTSSSAPNEPPPPIGFPRRDTKELDRFDFWFEAYDICEHLLPPPTMTCTSGAGVQEEAKDYPLNVNLLLAIQVVEGAGLSHPTTTTPTHGFDREGGDCL